MTNVDIDDLLSDEERTELSGAERRAIRERWYAVAWVMSGLSLAALLGAGIVLSRAGIGSAVVLRGCSWQFGAGLTLMIAAGALLGLGHLSLRMRAADRWSFDLNTALAFAAPPAIVGVVTGPAFVGCGFASRLADAGMLGNALVGAPGIALAGASCFAVGYCVLGSIRTVVDRPVGPQK